MSYMEAWDRLAQEARDVAFQRIKKEIWQTRTASLENFELVPEIQIKRTGPQLPGKVYSTAYCLWAWGCLEFATVTYDPATKEIQASYDGNSSTVSECIMHMKRTDRFGLGKTARGSQSKQRDWWTSNGKHFPLLALPAELRLAIYRAAFGDNVTFGKDGSNFAILTANQQVRKEAYPMLLYETPFLTEHLVDLIRIPRRVVFRNQLRYIQIATTFEQMFDMFGLASNSGEKTFKQIADRKPLRILRKLDLDRLEIIIPPPASREDGGSSPCHLRVTEWVLRSVWQRLRGQAMVVTGFVKKKMQADFDMSCQIEHARYLEYRKLRELSGRSRGDVGDFVRECDDLEEGGIRLDGQPEPAVAMNEGVWKEDITWASIEMPCMCNVGRGGEPCNVEEWAAE